MGTITFSVKGMVCNRCISALRSRLESNGILVKDVLLGEIEILNASVTGYEIISEVISSLGFEILLDKEARIVRIVKNVVQEALSTQADSSARLSTLIVQRTHLNYGLVSRIFSEKEGITIEHYFINQKIERVKQLLRESELSLTEISYLTKYSSVHHLSKQFKNVTGNNPTTYRQEFHDKSSTITQDYARH